MYHLEPHPHLRITHELRTLRWCESALVQHALLVSSRTQRVSQLSFRLSADELLSF